MKVSEPQTLNMSLLFSKISRDFMREMGARSRDMFELMSPPVDMYEEGSNLVIVVDLPGFQKEDIRTRLTEHHLVLSAKRESQQGDGVTYFEQSPLKVQKKILLPVKIGVDDEDLLGKYENGVLTIRLPIKGVGKVRVE